MGALDAPVQGASFYVEKIQPASSNTRNGFGVGRFQAKSSIDTYSDTNTSNFIIYKLKHFKQLFLYRTQKQPIMSPSSQFQIYFTL